MSFPSNFTPSGFIPVLYDGPARPSALGPSAEGLAGTVATFGASVFLSSTQSVALPGSPGGTYLPGLPGFSEPQRHELDFQF